MISTTQYSLFGIPMQQRRTRRRLVMVAYTAIAIVCGLTVAFIRVAPYLYSYAIWATLAFMFVVFGWQGRGGLIKPFPNKPPRPEPTMVTLAELQLRPKRPFADDTSAWRNDERELARRDLAHYHAYQPVAVGIVVLLVLTAIANHPWPWMSAAVLAQVSYAVALVVTVMAFTLPAAIILWTEPDIETNLRNLRRRERGESDDRADKLSGNSVTNAEWAAVAGGGVLRSAAGDCGVYALDGRALLGFALGPDDRVGQPAGRLEAGRPG
jgi:hypothetical protein